MVGIIITGPSGTGKSSFAELLSSYAGWTLVSKDRIKESCFRTLGCSSREESKEIGQLALTQMTSMISQHRSPGDITIFEGNLRTSWLEKVCGPQSPGGIGQFVQVQMSAPRAVLESRILARAASGDRHQGHFDLSALRDNAREISTGRFKTARIPGVVVRLDTTEINRQLLQAEARRVASIALRLLLPSPLLASPPSMPLPCRAIGPAQVQNVP